jgi:lipoprotein-anchoring transpeptidase ErfK/SrfK
MSVSGRQRHLCGAILFVAVLFAAAVAAPIAPAGAQTLSYMPADGGDPAYQTTLPQAMQPEAATADENDISGPLARQIVPYPSNEPPGTIIIDTAHTFLYLTLYGDRAIRYGIGVGRQGFTWSGVEAISRKSQWPDWIPPVEMVARQPYLPRWVGGGPGNPLGARALYLGNTDYRIHGTNDPTSIGKHVSSGCIRLRDADVIDLYNHVDIGTKVIVLPNDQRSAAIEAKPRTPLTAHAQSGLTAYRPSPVSVSPTSVAFSGLY